MSSADSISESLLLWLSLTAYFPELAKGRFGCVGDFIDMYLQCDPSVRPRTMFDGFCPDERSGVTRLMKRLRTSKSLRELRLADVSSLGDRYNSFCVYRDRITDRGALREIIVVFGGNYRVGDHNSAYGRTSTWRDNLLGAADADTAEQRGALLFYDAALAAAMSVPARIGISGYTVTVCGHSKGGNLAQYTALMRESVSACVSFDGQGFSESFMRRHRSRVLRRGRLIKSIMPENSIVGAALLSVPNSERKFVSTGRSGLYAHIPSSLADKAGRLLPADSRQRLLSRTVGRLSVGTVRTARQLPFCNARKGLEHIGRALQLIFKDDLRGGMRQLADPDVLGLLLAATLRLPFDLTCHKR